MADEERSEPFEQLEERVNRRVQEALSGLQQEIRDRLKRAGDQLVGDLDRELGDVASGLPTSFLPREELAPLTAEAEDAGRRQLLGHLLAALSAIDGAGSQRAVLDTLKEECRRFSGRTAVLLTGDEGYRLWGASGWGDDAPTEVTLRWGQAGPWSPATIGSGTAALTAQDCAPLCSRLESSIPKGGVLVPLILRDRLAAVVYADHDGGGGAFFAEALQALTWSAAMALEALPFRDRAATPTLLLAGSMAAAPVLAAPEPEPEPEPEAEEATSEAADESEVEVVEAVAVPGFEVEEETAVSFDGDEPSDDDGAESQEETDAEGWSLDDDDEPSSAVGELEVSELEVSDLEAGDDDSLPEPPAWEAPTLDTSLEEDTVLEEVGDGDELVLEDDFDDAVDGDLYTTEDDQLEVEELEVVEEEPAAGAELEVEELDEDEEVELVEETPAAAAPTAPMETDQVPRIAGFERAPAEPAAETSTPEAPPLPPADDRPPGLETAAAPAAPAAPAGDGSPQVAPPSDHSGPGLAFGGGGDAGDEDDVSHQEARRLARLLVDEIHLYNQDLIEEGRRNQDIYQRLKEDIDRSRQIYEERIDASLREDTDYFYDELVRTLGGGDASTLGI
ncbi:MAG TPA: hypothetical protein VKU40_09035 [Thermoanaerobaculia bacterium]|nr:hypothetical protein [Thermoanaerobaculia bacterium]